MVVDGFTTLALQTELIILAQASMVQALKALDHTQVPYLTSPEPGIAHVAKELAAQYRTLGYSRLKVAALTMGTFSFGAEGDFALAPHQRVMEAQRLVDASTAGSMSRQFEHLFARTIGRNSRRSP